MSVEKAKKNYLDRPQAGRKLNCCESILHAFKDKLQVSEELLTSSQHWGGGKAPDGWCGALYAAKLLLGATPDSSKRSSYEETFLKEAGSVKCREIRALKKLPCVQCVEKAAEAVEGK